MTHGTRPVVCVMGPTGAGKSALALHLATLFPCEIISVDSAQVYRGLDIGTAKPDPVQQRRVPHHLIDVCDPAEAYSAARFAADATRCIAEIRGRHRIPLLVGGTGLYFRALEGGFSPLPPSDPVIRSQLQAELAAVGSPALHARLAGLDALAAARIHPNDPQRILRALEVFAQTGTPLSQLQGRAPGSAMDGDIVRWVVAPTSRALLRERLTYRFAEMLERGLVNEVAGLRERGDLNPDLPAMRAVGYRAVWRYLAGELARQQMVHEAVTATHQLAKRQMTWFRGATGTTWWDVDAADCLARLETAFARLTEHGL